LKRNTGGLNIPKPPSISDTYTRLFSSVEVKRMKADWIGEKLYITIPCGLNCTGLIKDSEGNEVCSYLEMMDRTVSDPNIHIDDDCGKCWYIDSAALRIIFDCRYCP